VIKVALAGNPNVGKTVIFNALTGARQKVGNWPGVTVEKKEGMCKHKGFKMHIVDLPGIYGLSAASIDEKIARDFILYEKPDVVVDIVDASILERNLYLTLQLIEIGANVVIALNKMDIALAKGYKIDHYRLSKELGIPVVPTVAIKNQGINKLKDAIIWASKNPKRPVIRYNDEVENAIESIQSMLPKNASFPFSSRFLAIKILEMDEDILKRAGIERGVIEKWTSLVTLQ